MCGIACIYNPKKEISVFTLQKMIASLYHRGPNANGLTVEYGGYLGIGNTRLSLVDLHKRSNMPMKKNGVTLTFNGEIYNFRELRNVLKKQGYVFDTNSDTEVIIASYLHWGIECVSRFNGCFAFILYDKKHKKLFIARDQFGEKPLVYTHTSTGDWLFASEIKTLLSHPSVKREINVDFMLNQLILGLYGDQDMSAFKDIHYLPAGHYVCFDLTAVGQSPEFVKYSKFDDIKPENYSEKDLPDLSAHYAKLLSQSLKKRLHADVPLGSILSGGIDSSFITALADPIAFSYTKKDLACFSITYAKNVNTDFSYATLLCNSLRHTKLHNVSVTPYPTIDELEHLTAIFESPIFDMVQRSIFCNYQAVKNNSLKGVINGQGNDEFWLGYFLTDNVYRNLKKADSVESFCNYWYRISPYTQFFTKIMQERAKKIISANIEKNFMPYNGEDKLLAMTRFSTKTHLQAILLEEDKFSMANSVEVRLPYVDIDLYRFALSIPSRLKIWDRREKYIVRSAAGGILPESIIHRKKKWFPSPTIHYYNALADKTHFEKVKKSEILSKIFSKKTLTTMWGHYGAYDRYPLVAIEAFERIYS